MKVGVLIPLVLAGCAGVRKANGPSGSSDPQLSSWLNEPAGFASLSDRSMDSVVEAGWGDRGDARFTIVTNASAPCSPTKVGQALFPRGYVGGSGPINTWLSLKKDSLRQVYVGLWIEVSRNFVGAPSAGINKVLHIWIGGKSKVVLALMGSGLGPLTPQLRLQNMSADTRGNSFNLQPTKRGAVTTRGKWCLIEILLRANTAGNSDGEAALWVDGVLTGSYHNLGYEGATEPPNWESVSWNPTWGAPSDTVPADMEMWIDHFKVSGR